MRNRAAALVVAASALAVVPASAQKVTRENVPGIMNFARLETTIACAGTVKVEAVPEIKKMGYAAIINVREAGEPGANVENEAAAAQAAGLRFVHIPFNIASPAADLVDRFIVEVAKPENQPAFVHCAAGGRAASLWMIKRVKVDHWDEARALEEATALGLNERLKPFALDYIHTHLR